MKHIFFMSFLMLLLVSCQAGQLNSDANVSKVFKYDDSIQCEDEGIPLKVMARELIGSGIAVLGSQKGHDGLVRAAACGTPTGNINIYLIQTNDLANAKSLGFKPIEKFSEEWSP